MCHYTHIHTHHFYNPMKKTIKAYFRQKPFKSIKDSYVPVPVHKGRMLMKDVIARMNYRSTWDEASIAVIIDSFHQTAMDLAADGYNVDAGLVYLRAMITGTNSTHQIDRKLNKVVVAAIPGKKLRKAGEKTTIIVGNNRNVYKGMDNIRMPNRRDSTIFEGSVVKITGNHIKIAGDEPICGIRFINNETKEIIHVPASHIYDNFSKSLLIKLPAELKAGNYTLQISTTFCGTVRLLKKPKTYELFRPVVIVPEGSV